MGKKDEAEQPVQIVVLPHHRIIQLYPHIMFSALLKGEKEQDLVLCEGAGSVSGVQ